MFEFMAAENQFFDDILPLVQFIMAFIVFYFIYAIWYFWDDTAAQRLTARIFLKYRQFRIGIFLCAIGAAVELIAYTLAILTGTLANIYVIAVFMISTVIYIVGFVIILYVALSKRKRWIKKLAETKEGGAQ